jgi:4-hydroxy-3-methylbut-2-enyl diphosphate reductase
MISTLEQSAQAGAKNRRIWLAAPCGMDPEARGALEKLEALARGGGRVGVAGEFMPDSGVAERLAALGVAERVEEADFFRFRHLVIPYAGVAPGERKRWVEADVPLTDLSSPHVRRAQVALGMLRMEGAQPLVIGRHDDPETRTLAGTCAGARVIEDTTDTARLPFAPAFGAVCQTTLSPRRARWLLEQLRMRYRDARVTALTTAAPAMAAREQALETLLEQVDGVVIVGRPGEASVEALAETALRKGKPAQIAATAETLEPTGLRGIRRIGLSAGAFATEAGIRAIYQALRQMV